MNVENINLVADTIEDHAKRKEGLRGVGFNMADYVSSRDDKLDKCGTVACIGGWTYLVAHPSIRRSNLEWSTRRFHDAYRFLGITDDAACRLFCPDPEIVGLSDITPRQAVRVLRHLAKTGKVDWSPKVRGRP